MSYGCPSHDKLPQTHIKHIFWGYYTAHWWIIATKTRTVGYSCVLSIAWTNYLQTIDLTFTWHHCDAQKLVTTSFHLYYMTRDTILYFTPPDNVCIPESLLAAKLSDSLTWYPKVGYMFYTTHSLLKLDNWSIVTVRMLAVYTLQWRNNGRHRVSNHQLHDCLLDCSFRRRSKKTSKLRVTCPVNSPQKWPVMRKMLPFDDVIMRWNDTEETESATVTWYYAWCRHKMETFSVTGPVCGEFTGHRWISLTKVSDVELWCFLWSVLE